MRQRVIAYIDGFNLYYGLRQKGWRWAYWLNLQTLLQLYLKPGQILQQTKYFTAVVSSPPDKHNRQNEFIEALYTLSDIEIIFGHFLSNPITCVHCGHTYTAYHEKMTDVNIATRLLTDAFQNQFDIALLVSADSDLTPPIQAIQNFFPKKRIVALFPPGRSSKELMRVANGYTYIGATQLRKSQFPDQVVKSDGFILHRPESWK